MMLANVESQYFYILDPNIVDADEVSAGPGTLL